MKPLSRILQLLESREEVYEILLSSNVQAGAFDGGCLILARAIHACLTNGKIIHIFNASKNCIEHYGVLLGEMVIDGDGTHKNTSEWMDFFRNIELIPKSHHLMITPGVCNRSKDIDDNNAVKALINIFKG